MQLLYRNGTSHDAVEGSDLYTSILEAVIDDDGGGVLMHTSHMYLIFTFSPQVSHVSYVFGTL